MFHLFKYDIWLSNPIIRRPNLQNNFKLFIKILFPPAGLQDTGLESREAVVSTTFKLEIYWTGEPAWLPFQLAGQWLKRN
jgi:hypothetical protein